MKGLLKGCDHFTRLFVQKKKRRDFFWKFYGSIHILLFIVEKNITSWKWLLPEKKISFTLRKYETNKNNSFNNQIYDPNLWKIIWKRCVKSSFDLFFSTKKKKSVFSYLSLHSLVIFKVYFTSSLFVVCEVT
jgi:hypothetical protein